MCRNISFISLLFVLLMGGVHAFAQDQIEHVWYNQEKTSKIQVFKAKDGKFYGKVVWLKVTQEHGHDRTDENNPDKARQSDPLMGLMVLKGLKKEGGDLYDDGTIYDPKNGKTYSCKITYKGNELDLRGYYGISLIGRTTTWTKAD